MVVNDEEIENDEIVAREEDTDQLDVPNKAPVNEPVNDPVMGEVRLLNWRELETVPGGNPVGKTYDDVIA